MSIPLRGDKLFLWKRSSFTPALTSLPITAVSPHMKRAIEEENELLRKTFGHLVNKVNAPKEFIQVTPGLFLYCTKQCAV